MQSVWGPCPPSPPLAPPPGPQLQCFYILLLLAHCHRPPLPSQTPLPRLRPPHPRNRPAPDSHQTPAAHHHADGLRHAGFVLQVAGHHLPDVCVRLHQHHLLPAAAGGGGAGALRPGQPLLAEGACCYSTPPPPSARRLAARAWRRGCGCRAHHTSRCASAARVQRGAAGLGLAFVSSSTWLAGRPGTPPTDPPAAGAWPPPAGLRPWPAGSSVRGACGSAPGRACCMPCQLQLQGHAKGAGPWSEWLLESRAPTPLARRSAPSRTALTHWLLLVHGAGGLHARLLAPAG